MPQSREQRKNKKTFNILAATVSLPTVYTATQRHKQLKGVLPKGWSCHHCKPLHLGGTHDIKNLSIAEDKNHQRIDDNLQSMDTSDWSDEDYVSFASDNNCITWLELIKAQEKKGYMDSMKYNI